jgi:hypothetical protein
MGRMLLEAVGAAASMAANCECDSGDFMGDPQGRSRAPGGAPPVGFKFQCSLVH